ncbi:MAG: tRNA-modifying protein YgfZ [Alteromonadaceae bacterium]|nr:tRNA-modifying protein YgfZ [Alteromonadaceae bacterium]
MTLSIETMLPTLEELPDTFLISLSEYGAISLSGEEQSKYLQGQITCDVNDSTENSLIHGAHCDAKGKVFSTFRLINRLSEHLLMQPKTSLNASLAELKKFGVFAKVTISETSSLSFYAIVGEHAAEVIQKTFEQVPCSLTPVIQSNSTTLVYISGQKNRYLIIDKTEQIEPIINVFNLPVYTQAIWEMLEITEGFPIISESAIKEYVPQMLNLQAISGISFTKGCYLGQETVARMQYLGKNKRALFSLSGKAENKVIAGDILEKQLGENWRKAGNVIASYHADNGTIYLQAVLANDIETDQLLRLKNIEQSTFELVALPYSLI